MLPDVAAWKPWTCKDGRVAVPCLYILGQVKSELEGSSHGEICPVGLGTDMVMASGVYI